MQGTCHQRTLRIVTELRNTVERAVARKLLYTKATNDEGQKHPFCAPHGIGEMSERMNPMLWTILAVLLVLWLLGLIGGIGGSLIHLLLVVALIVLIAQLVTGRRGTAL